MNSSDDISDDLRALNADAAPPDCEFLRQLRDRSTHAFTAGTAPEPREESSPGSITFERLPQNSHVSMAQPGGHNMLLTRMVLSLTAALIAGIAWFAALLSQNEAIGGPTLEAALRKTLDASSLQLEIVRSGSTQEVLIAASNLRMQQSPTRYVIARGSTLWEIDEAANTAARRENRWGDPQGQIDLLQLLTADVPVTGSSLVKRAVAVGPVTHNGRTCRLYRLTASAGTQSLQIDAYVDRDTGLLNSLVCWPAGLRSGDQTPLAELRLIARNAEVDEAQFVVAKSLSHDGRIGRVVDQQGIVTLRPPLMQRWTPVAAQMLIRPRDVLRTDIRGANAARVLLTSQFEITLGPGSQVELISPRQIRVLDGEVQVLGPAGAEGPLEIIGPQSSKHTLSAGESRLLRVTPREGQAALVTLKDKPKWLTGFEGTATQESLGSLIANVDGRNVPLTVGFHHVSVEIRDQIARTTVTESFVNHTDARLEGVFHFPLPQDASISGFAMWIGEELVEADIVEKQRAREIYETILREKRDPALLEWTGGNIFKARVFPIEARSEKKVRITYTQVLPLRANRYRYSYGLRSELLRLTPLRDLSIHVLVHSALPLKAIECPTHEARTAIAPARGPAEKPAVFHAAQVEFTAQQYVPDRDFEVVCEVDQRQSDVVVIPHQRGDDGYLLVQLTPPAPEGNWQREVLPDGEPLDLVLLCDTSGSMDRPARQQQEQLVAALLNALGPDDRFRVAVCDVKTHWLQEEPVAPSAAVIEQVRDELNRRESLGWTNLDEAFEAVRAKAGPRSHVIYIGDGIVTARDADPQAFAQRLSSASKKNRAEPGAVFHAVSVSSQFESVVLRAIAGLSGGSVRSVEGSETPQQTALELLNEMAQPGLRDLQVEFRGVRVAAVYPERLPNLAAGTQQILVGRYLPEGRDQSGEIIVSGRRGTEPVRYAARISLTEAEQGNSFIPRLWARARLDELLQQGRGDAIKDEIIALSEEFHIITPYTSLLVLESDADRERFGVQRRSLMRDGEKFFADGRQAARLSLQQEQMKQAGAWRLGLRRQVLAGLISMGRFSEQQRQQLLHRQMESWNRPVSRAGTYWSFGGGAGGAFQERFGRSAGLSLSLGDTSSTVLFFDEYSSVVAGDEFRWGVDKKLGNLFVDDFISTRGNLPDLVESKSREGLLPISLPQEWDSAAFGQQAFVAFDLMPGQFAAEEPALFAFGGRLAGEVGLAGLDSLRLKVASKRRAESQVYGEVQDAALLLFGPRRSEPAATAPDLSLLSELLAPPPPVARSVHPKPSLWPEEAVAISQSLSRRESLQKLTGGLEVRVTTERFDPVWRRETDQSTQYELFSPARWLTRPESDHHPALVHACEENERGAYSQTWRLASVRPAKADDRTSFLPGEAQPVPHERHGLWRLLSQPAGPDRVQWTLTPPDQPQLQVRYTIDTARKVIVREEHFADGLRNIDIESSDFVNVAGLWWPARITQRDHKDRLIRVTTQTVTALSADQFAEKFAAERSGLPKPFRFPLPTVAESDAAVQAGRASAEHHLTRLLQAASVQKWEDAFRHLDSLEKIAPEPDDVRWMRLVLRIAARRNEEARQQILTEADWLLTQPSQRLVRAEWLIGKAGQIVDAHEMLPLVERLKPAFEGLAEFVEGPDRWSLLRIQWLSGAGQRDESLRLRKELALARPWDLSLQIDTANELFQSGDREGGQQWLQREIDRDIERHDSSFEWLFRTMIDRLEERGMYQSLPALIVEWRRRLPGSELLAVRLLSSLALAGRSDELKATLRQWIAEGRRDGELPAEVLAPLRAALDFARGSGYRLYRDHIAPEWRQLLEETAAFFLQRPEATSFELASRIIEDRRFQDCDESDRLRQLAFERLHAQAAMLDPHQAAQLAAWAMPDTRRRPAELWRPIITVLRQRWDALAVDDPTFARLGRLLRDLYQHIDPGQASLFLRQQIQRLVQTEPLPESVRPLLDQYRQELFGSLLYDTWKLSTTLKSRPQDQPAALEIAQEDEAFALLSQLAAHQGEGDRLQQRVESLQLFVERAIGQRERLLIEQHQLTGQPENMTRTELAQKQAELRRAALLAISDRLKAAITDDSFGRWLHIEQLWLDVSINRHLPAVLRDAWTLLGDDPAAGVVNQLAAQNDEELTPDQQEAELQTTMRHLLEAGLKWRALATIARLSARRDATEAEQQRLLTYLEKGIATGGERSSAWKQQFVRMLIALDRPEQLEQKLRDWIRTGPAEEAAQWQLMLARLLAERGTLDEPIALLLSLEKQSQLTPQDYEQLAAWALAVGNESLHRRTKLERWKAEGEYQLHGLLSHFAQQWSNLRRALTEDDLEPALLILDALLTKSSTPENYTATLAQLFAVSQDFRLLKAVPDAMTGRTPQQVYDFAPSLNSSVLNEVRNEAAADSILERIQELRQSADGRDESGRRLTAVDQRALDLLEALVERQSSEVLNQPEAHRSKCIAALQRAFQREWAPGEIPQMARFLTRLGDVPELIAEESLRELKALHALTVPASDERLEVSYHLAGVLTGRLKSSREALLILEADFIASAQAAQYQWRGQFDEPLDRYLWLLREANRWSEAEAVLERFLAASPLPEHREQLRRRQERLWLYALRSEARVKPGDGPELYRFLLNHLTQRADTDDPQVQQQSFDLIGELFSAAAQKTIVTLSLDVRAWCFQQFPQLMRAAHPSLTQQFEHTARLVSEYLGYEAGIEFLLDRMDHWPEPLNHYGDSGWSQFAERIGKWKNELTKKDLKLNPQLNERLLAAMDKQLRRTLLTRQTQSWALIHHSYNYFDSELTMRFLKIAEEVLAERKDSERSVVFIAEYMYDGLAQFERSISVLLEANSRRLLGIKNQEEVLLFQLFEWHFDAEAALVLEGLVEQEPERLDFICDLIGALHRSKRPEQARDLFVATARKFRASDLWTEHHHQQLAERAAENGYHDDVVQLYRELIPRLEKSQFDRSTRIIGQIMAYGTLADALSQLGRTAEAVDAAASAIAVWPGHQRDRQEALDRLRRILRDAKDLDEYLTQRDADVEKSGQDSPVIRKQAGLAYRERGEHDKAARQLLLALELQPGDREARRILIEELDAAGRKEEATRQLFAFLEEDRHQLDLHRRLAERLSSDPELSERAATSIVEAAPQESEHHAALAELRQAQNRWSEAIDHWKHATRLRSLEPGPLVKLAEAELHEQRWSDAGSTIRKLETQVWPAHLGDVAAQIKALRARLPEPQ